MKNEFFSKKRDLDQYIKTRHPDLRLRRGNGYYYFHVAEDQEDNRLSQLYGLETTSVYVFNQNELTRKEWAAEVDAVLICLNDEEEFEFLPHERKGKGLSVKKK